MKIDKNTLNKIFLGKRMSDSELSGEKYNVLWGIPVFASDAISSVSYAGEEILLVLLPALGLLSYKHFLPIVAAIIGLLAILVFCYRQTIDEYPHGGGAYIVAEKNLGEIPGLIAGAALIIGYILTVAVSSCAGAAAIISAFPHLLPLKPFIAFGIIVLLTWGNLRGMRESAILFGVPTYVYIAVMLVMIVTGIIRYTTGNYTPAEIEIVTQNSHDTLLFLVLKAFASGCTALTGVEAVSNGVANFRDPAQKNAKKVLIAMAGFVCIVFFGVSLLIKWFNIAPSEDATAISVLASTVFGSGSLMYYVIQIMTVIILALAANTAYAGLPLLMAVIAKDGYLPRWLSLRGARLNFSNGIIVLFITSSILVFAFNGSQHYLLPLYASGVFISFLLSQVGMLMHWVHRKDEGWKFKAAVNGFGTLVTGLTLVVIAVMKFTQGAWITLVCIAGLVFMMYRIKRHYDTVSNDLKMKSFDEVKKILSYAGPGKAILPTASLTRSFVKTLNSALGCGFDEIEIYTVSDSEEDALEIQRQIRELDLDDNVYFAHDSTPYRNINQILVHHVEKEAANLPPHRNITVMMSAIVPNNIWEAALHNHTTNRLQKVMERNPKVSVFTVPYILKKTDRSKISN